MCFKGRLAFLNDLFLDMSVCMCVHPVMGCHPIQGVPQLVFTGMGYAPCSLGFYVRQAAQKILLFYTTVLLNSQICLVGMCSLFITAPVTIVAGHSTETSLKSAVIHAVKFSIRKSPLYIL